MYRLLSIARYVLLFRCASAVSIPTPVTGRMSSDLSRFPRIQIRGPSGNSSAGFSDPIADPFDVDWIELQQQILDAMVEDATPVVDDPPPPPASPSPTFDVSISENSVPIGDANGQDSADFRRQLFDGLKALCPDDATECDHTTPVTFHDIPAVIDGVAASLQIDFTIETSVYIGPVHRDDLLALAVSSWQQASVADNSCTDADYTEYINSFDGCGDLGPVRRSPVPVALDKRVECVGSDCQAPHETCHYTAHVCSAPRVIAVNLGDTEDPYANKIIISVHVETEGDIFSDFLCDVAASFIKETAMAVFPELAPVDAEALEAVGTFVCGSDEFGI